MFSHHRKISSLVIVLTIILVGCSDNSKTADQDEKDRQLAGVCRTGSNETQNSAPCKDLEKRGKLYHQKNDPSQNLRLMVMNAPPTIGAYRETEQDLLAEWQQQIIANSQGVSDAEILTSYNSLLAFLDNSSDQQIANTLLTTYKSLADFEVILYRITPQMRTNLWNRLPISRVNHIIDYMPSSSQSSQSWYFGQLSKINLAPSSSVPWSRI